MAALHEIGEKKQKRKNFFRGISEQRAKTQKMRLMHRIAFFVKDGLVNIVRFRTVDVRLRRVFASFKSTHHLNPRARTLSGGISLRSVS
jgi:hypothetical protein